MFYHHVLCVKGTYICWKNICEKKNIRNDKNSCVNQIVGNVAFLWDSLKELQKYLTS